MKKSNLFFETFAGEFVEIVQDFEITTSFNQHEDHMHEVRMPMTVSGFVMDTDDEFIYLSPDGENVNQALPIHTIKHIGIVQASNELQDLLDSVPNPSDKKDFN